MAQIYDSLKNLINPDMISKASALLGEKESKVSSAASAIVPGLLAALAKKGDTPQVKNTLEEAGKANILSDVNSVFSADCTVENQSLGDKFLLAVLGPKASDFTNSVATASGLSNGNAAKLTSRISSVVAGFLGNKMVSGNQSLSGIIGDLNNEKKNFMGLVPAGVVTALGLNNLNGNTRNTTYTTTPAKTKKNNSWIWWVILIILLLLLIFWWRSCRNHDNSRVDNAVDTVRNRSNEWVDTVSNRTMGNHRDSVLLRLPNGETFYAYKNSTEDKMIDFLNSDRYKNANNDDLKSRWFEFEDIDFVFGSSTQLMDGAQRHLNNVIAILKAYPDAKIRIAGNADKVGGDQANQNISEARANTIKNKMVSAGINANRIITEGFGEEKATIRENASNDERAKDRDIAFRFVK